MKHKAINKLTVSTQGHIRNYQGDINFDVFFEKGKHLAENVHINDKIALVTLLDNARIGKKDNNNYFFRFNDKNGIFNNFQMSNATLGINGITIDCQPVDEKQQEPILCTKKVSSEKCRNLTHKEIPALTLVAHEMREPLNAIIGFSDFLLYEFAGKLESATQHQYAHYIKESGNHLLDLITTYLEKQKEENSYIHQDVNECIAEALAMTSHLTKKHKVVFTPTTHYSYFTTLKSLQLKQVLINLITNAAKYSAVNSIITIQQRVLKNNHLLLTVSDTGSGMAEDEIKELSQPFKRANNVISTKIDGHGIGLSLVFDIIETAKGSVTISSRKNRGTTISITLPLTHKASINKTDKQQKNDEDNLHLLAMTSKMQTLKLHEKYLSNGKSNQKVNKTA